MLRAARCVVRLGPAASSGALHHATHEILFACTSRKRGSPKDIIAFLVPTDAPGCNYRANRSCCEVAGRAMQTCGGVGYSRHMPFEHIYRHHRRDRITEGSEEIQMRKVAQQLFGL
jgi:alkylation response protein AidB-like acyl-CoA dehydrogenase